MVASEFFVQADASNKTFGFFIVGPDAGGPNFEGIRVMEPAVPERQGLYDPPTSTTLAAWALSPTLRAKDPQHRRAGFVDPQNIDHRGAVGADPLQG